MDPNFDQGSLGDLHSERSCGGPGPSFLITLGVTPLVVEDWLSRPNRQLVFSLLSQNCRPSRGRDVWIFYEYGLFLWEGRSLRSSVSQKKNRLTERDETKRLATGRIYWLFILANVLDTPEVGRRKRGRAPGFPKDRNQFSGRWELLYEGHRPLKSKDSGLFCDLWVIYNSKATPVVIKCD